MKGSATLAFDQRCSAASAFATALSPCDRSSSEQSEQVREHSVLARPMCEQSASVARAQAKRIKSTRIGMRFFIYACVCANVYVCVCVSRERVCARVNVRVHACACAGVRACAHMCVRVRMCACARRVRARRARRVRVLRECARVCTPARRPRAWRRTPSPSEATRPQ
eukprot:450075-Pleurochrysis_carterae.AAC.1